MYKLQNNPIKPSANIINSNALMIENSVFVKHDFSSSLVVEPNNSNLDKLIISNINANIYISYLITA